MALIEIAGAGIALPKKPGFSTTPSFNAVALQIDASGEKAAFVVQVPKTGTLDTVGIRFSTVSVNAASQLRISFQDVDTTNGDPDGTQDQFRDTAGSGLAVGWFEPGLITSDGSDSGTKRSVTRGQLLTVVMEYQTFTAADNLVFSCIATTTADPVLMQCYGDLFIASWTKQSTLLPILTFKYSDGTYEVPDGIWPASALTSRIYNSSSTPDERGLLFRLPVPVRLRGAWVQIDLDGDADMVLYDSSWTTLETVAFDANIRVTTTSTSAAIVFSTNYDLQPNADYRLTVRPATTTNLTIYDIDVNSVAILDAMPGGQYWRYTERTNAGPWTDTATRRPFMGLIFSGFEDGTGVEPGLPPGQMLVPELAYVR